MLYHTQSPNMSKEENAILNNYKILCGLTWLFTESNVWIIDLGDATRYDKASNSGFDSFIIWGGLILKYACFAPWK